MSATRESKDPIVERVPSASSSSSSGSLPVRKLVDDLKKNGTPIDKTVPAAVLEDVCFGYLFAEEKYDQNMAFFSNVKSTLESQAAKAAKHVLWGRADEAVALVQKNPDILSYTFESKDPRGRRVRGTLLQIAAMAGDVNLRDKKPGEEKDHGMVELLAQAGGLSPEDVVIQLAPIFSPEALAGNKKRNDRVLAAIKKFAESIISRTDLPPEVGSEEKFKVYRDLCKPAIDTLRSTVMTPNPHEVITSGYIFDPQILVDAMEWFEQNLKPKRFHDWWSLKSDLFWVNGIGTLQAILSARDAHVIRHGIGRYAENDTALPSRTLDNSDKSSYFFNSSSRLGIDFFLGYYGYGALVACGHEGAVFCPAFFKAYVEQKQKHYKLMPQLESKPSTYCVIL